MMIVMVIWFWNLFHRHSKRIPVTVRLSDGMHNRKRTVYYVVRRHHHHHD